MTDAIATARLQSCLTPWGGEWTYRQVGRVAQVAPSVVHRLAHGRQTWASGDGEKVLSLLNLERITRITATGPLPNAQDYPEPEDGDA